MRNGDFTGMKKGKRIWHRAIGLMMAVAVMVSGMMFSPVKVQAKTYSGQFKDMDFDGKALSWSYDLSEKTLTITGEGDLKNQLESMSYTIGQAVSDSGELVMGTLIEKVVFKDCKGIGNWTMAFGGPSCANGADGYFSDLKELDLSGLDATNIITAAGFFGGCNKLEKLDVSKFNVKNFDYYDGLFVGCSSLKKLDLRSFDTSNWTRLSQLFLCCGSLEEIDFTGWDTSKVTSMASLFDGCTSLKTIDLSGFDTRSLTGLSQIFRNCSSLKTLDLSGFDTSKLTWMSEAFYGCTSLEELNLSSFDLSLIKANETMTGGGQFGPTVDMFKGCKSLRVLYTPKKMSAEMSADLPRTFVDPNGRKTNKLTAEFANTVLVADFPVSGVGLNQSKLSLKEGENATLVATVSPENATSKSVTWKSSDTSVAEVDGKGTVTAKKAGTATITATASDGSGKSASCSVTVAKAEAEIHFAWNAKNLQVGEKYLLIAFSGLDTISNVTWSSSDQSVATVDSEGRVRALKAGRTTIKATVKGGSSTASMEVTVSSDLTGAPFSILYCPEKFWIGRTYTLEAYLFYEKFTDVTWSSSDSSVVSVSSSGEVKALKAGKATITVKPNGTTNASASCTINVEGSSSSSSSSGSSSTGSTSSGSTTTTDKTPQFGWFYKDGKAYWYEGGKRQGTFDDPNGVLGDGTVRGREIYDPDSDGWYWLDSVYDGAKAVSKEVWMPYIYQNEKSFSYSEILDNAANSGDMANQVAKAIREGTGKWVRYDSNGKMYKGWYTVSGADARLYPDQAGNTYYYDAKTGLMAKGKVKIDGRTYYFDETTGALQK